MPLYNKAPYVAKAIESVLNQTCTDYELVIMDDGSTDDSYIVASKTIEGRDNCHIEKQENAGVSMARNNAVAMSRGDYLCFLDADDWWAPSFLERMDWLINEYPDAGIYGTNYYYVKNGRQRICVTSAETGYIDYCRVYADKLSMPLTSISVAVKPKIFNEMHGFPERIKLGEDFLLWIKIALKYKVAFLNEPLAYYNQDSAPEWRGIKRLHEPRYHMLWNLGNLEEEERKNPNYKRLVDGLRVYGLLPYYLSKDYRDNAKAELCKVDWSKQPKEKKAIYTMPIFLLKCYMGLRKCGSIIKQYIIKHL